MAQRLNYGSMDDKAKPKADEAAAKPAAEAEPAKPAAETAPAADPAKADAKPDDPKARHGAALKALRGQHKTERRDTYKRHLGDIESMQARHDQAIEDMNSANEAELAGPVSEAATEPAAEE